MYLEHFKLNELPFSLPPNTNFYCNLSPHQDALNALFIRLQQGETCIKIIGKMGTGKTLLCKLLLNKLDEEFITTYINPRQNGCKLSLLLVHELGLTLETDQQYILPDIITDCLLTLPNTEKPKVLIIDEAQSLTAECLETIEQLSSLEINGKKLLHIVLCGQPSLEKKLKKHTQHLLKRITFSWHLKKLNKNELNQYLFQRLAMAGCDSNIFSADAKKHLFRSCGGLPQVFNLLCHKALLISYGRGINQVDSTSMKRAIADTESVLRSRHLNTANIILVLTTAICAALILVVYQKAGYFNLAVPFFS